MAIEDIKFRRIARELQEWVYLGIEDGMVQSANAYKTLMAAGRTAEAEAQLKRAADMPFRAQARIEAYEALYGTAYIEKCLALYGDVTLAELKAEIVAKQDYALAKAKDINNAKVSNTTVANDITASVKTNAGDWMFPIPATYTEICDKDESKTLKATAKA